MTPNGDDDGDDLSTTIVRTGELVSLADTHTPVKGHAFNIISELRWRWMSYLHVFPHQKVDTRKQSKLRVTTALKYFRLSAGKPTGSAVPYLPL
jgi:hypothetical protein